MPIHGGTTSGGGTQGPQGESAYQIAVRVDGFVGTEAQWLDSLKGEVVMPTITATAPANPTVGTVWVDPTGA